MKKNLTAILLGSMGFYVMSVSANSGTIDFVGELTANTCNVSINGGSGDEVVTLPTLSTSLLANPGETGGRTGFKVGLSGCSGTNQTASVFFQPGSSVNTDGRLTNTGSATNVELQLLDGNNGYAVINAGNTDQVANTSYADVTSGEAILPYAVQYYATGNTTAGTVASTVTYNIQYK